MVAEHGAVLNDDLVAAGLRERFRPPCANGASVAPDLFALADEIAARERAIALLEESFTATDPALLAPGDARICRRELARRRRDLAAARQRYEGLRARYVEELLEAVSVPPAIARLVTAARRQD